MSCSYDEGDCVAYTTAGKVLATLKLLDHPEGVAADRQDNSYIANTSNFEVLKYTRSFRKLMETYEDPGQYPGDVDVDAPDRLLVVSNVATTSAGPGSVSVYAKGSLHPTATLTDPAVGSAEGIGIALDKSGNCFWSLYDEDTGHGQIDEFKNCAGSPHEIVSGIEFPGGVAFDDSGDLYYADQDAGAIYKCSPKGGCAVLTTGFAAPVFINFDDRWKFLWVADAAADTVNAVDRASGLIAATFTAAGGVPYGVAHAPGPLY
jgi:DNA-binding beta-propeller fold protein YncE